jgi:hypothetical protein
MDDDQKWLEAAAGIEQDIGYLKSAMGASLLSETPSGLEQDIQSLKTVLSIYKKNAAKGVAWPKPDDLFCIHAVPYGVQQVSTATRRDFKTAF